MLKNCELYIIGTDRWGKDYPAAKFAHDIFTEQSTVEDVITGYRDTYPAVIHCEIHIAFPDTNRRQ